MATTDQSRQSGNGILTSDQIRLMDPNHPHDLALLVEYYQMLFNKKLYLEQCFSAADAKQKAALDQETHALQATMNLIKETLKKRQA